MTIAGGGNNGCNVDSDCGGSSSPTCNYDEVTLSVSPNPVSPGQDITFSISGDASTYISDDYGGGVSGNCSGSWDNITCTATSTSGTYTWTHKWKNCVGSINNCSSECSESVSYEILSSLPSSPTGLSGSCDCALARESNCNCNLDWNDVTGATKYALRVNDLANDWSGTCDWTYEGDVCKDITFSSYSFTGKGGHSYNWWVHAVNAGGWSDAAYGTNFGAPYRPAAPTNLTCSVDFSSCVEPANKPNVSLKWTDNSDNETGFKIYHQLNTDPFSLLDATPVNTTTYSHQVDCDRNLHSYQVRSTNSCGDSAFSNSCSVQCVDIAPDKANYLSDGTFQVNQDILLSWENISNWRLNCTGNNNQYLVYYCKAGTDNCSATSVPNTNQCSLVVNNSPTTGYSSCTLIGPLDWESTYYWKVVTSNGATLVSTAYSFFKITHPSAWWQTKTGDVYGNNILSPIWRTVPEAQRYFSLENPTFFGPQSGLVAAPNCLGLSGVRCNFGAAQATQTEFPTSGQGGINADFTPLLNDYSYDQLAHLVDLAIYENDEGEKASYNSEVKVISGVSAEGIERSELTDPDDANKIIYYYFSDSGSVSVDSPLTMGSGDKKLIIFIDGNLHIDQNITVTPGFLAFIVKGNIEIAANVTQVQGVYFADGSLTVESVGDTNEQQFNGQGIFVGKEGVVLERSFRDERNTTTPTEIFTFDPAYLFTAPKVFREKPYLWQEMIP